MYNDISGLVVYYLSIQNNLSAMPSTSKSSGKSRLKEL